MGPLFPSQSPPTIPGPTATRTLMTEPTAMSVATTFRIQNTFLGTSLGPSGSSRRERSVPGSRVSDRRSVYLRWVQCGQINGLDVANRERLAGPGPIKSAEVKRRRKRQANRRFEASTVSTRHRGFAVRAERRRPTPSIRPRAHLA